jgi:hypothetical protein
MEQRKGAIKILDQLADRERERADAEEARRAEGEEMKRRIQALKEEEQRVGAVLGGADGGADGCVWLVRLKACVEQGRRALSN